MNSGFYYRGLDIIVEFGILRTCRDDNAMNTESIDQVRDVFRSFLLGSIAYHDVAHFLVSNHIPTTGLNNINEILIEAHHPKNGRPTQNLPAKTHINKLQRWTQYDDNRLLAGVLLFGEVDWVQISNFAAIGRDKVQCRQRYIRSLNPKISKAIWTPEEDQLLLSLVSGLEKIPWTKISKIIKNRNDVQCRYRYQQLIQKSELTQKANAPSLQTESLESNSKMLPRCFFKHDSKDPMDPISVSQFLSCFQKVVA